MPKFQTTLLFDLDGTLIDSTPAILEGFHYAFVHLGAAEPSDEAIKRLIGHPLEVMFERLSAARDVRDFVLAYKHRYAQIFLDQTVLLNGAYEAVQEASEFANLGVVTTKTSKFSKILLQHLGIADFFGTIIGREDVQDPKPSAEPILKALENLGICGATASQSSYAISGKTHDATADGRGAVLGEISISDLPGSQGLGLDPSGVCERNLNGISGEISGEISFRNFSETGGESDEDGASDKSRKGDGSKACIEGRSNECEASGDKIYCTRSVQTYAAPKAPSLRNQSIFMIGDTLLDAVAAKSAAVRSVGVSCGYGSASELRAHFEFVCADAREAVGLIREISSRF